MEVETIVLKGYERILRLSDVSTRGRLIACIHDTTLGPAVGCLSLRTPHDHHEAVGEACDLARAMTWKAVASELEVGGAHIALIPQELSLPRERQLQLVVHVLELLGGSLYATEGPGITPEDLLYLRRHTPYVAGLPEEHGGSGDPSLHTAQGVLEALRIALDEVSGSTELQDRTFAVQGLGRAGRYVVALLCEAQGHVIATDTDTRKVERLQSEVSFEAVLPEEIYSVPCEAFVPCAVPHVLNAETVPRLRCKVVAGAANEQLKEKADALRLAERGILYIPDFVANAGGIIGLSCEIGPVPCRGEEMAAQIRKVGGRVRMLLDRASAENTTPFEAARRFVKERIGTAKAAVRRLNL